VSLDERMIRLALWCAGQEHEARRAGKPPGVQPWNAELVRALELELGVASSGHPPERNHALSESCWISCREAARLLGISRRQAHRLTGDLDGVLVDGRWLFRQAVVEEYAKRRRGEQVA
jgi:hypothetical protein